MSLGSECFELYNTLCDEKSPEDIFSDCVKQRLGSIIELQGSYMDESINNLKVAVSKNLNTVDDLKNMNRLFKSVYHYLGVNRLKLIDILIDVEENSKNLGGCSDV